MCIRDRYVYIANSYKNFKKYEQARIVSDIQSQIISSGENAYLVTDDFMHVMSYNRTAQAYLRKILGASADEQLSSTAPCSWLPFLPGGEDTGEGEEKVKTRVIQGYIFRIYTYDPVSYTHLDVYKRQAVYQSGIYRG